MNGRMLRKATTTTTWRGAGLGRPQGRRGGAVVRATPLPLDIKKVTPVGGRTFVKVDEIEDQTKGGILLPDQAQTKQTIGTVVVADEGMEFGVGSKVVYSQFAGTELEVEGKDHVLLKDDEKTSSGIFLTGSTKEKPSTGKVLAVGPGRKDEDGKVEAVDVAVGTTVLYNKFSGVDFEANDGTPLMVIKDHDVLACLD